MDDITTTKYYNMSYLSFPPYTKNFLWTVGEDGKYMINLNYYQVGLSGNDTLFLEVDDRLSIQLPSSEQTSDRVYFNSYVILNLKRYENIYLRTSVSGIQMSERGLSSLIYKLN